MAETTYSTFVTELSSSSSSPPPRSSTEKSVSCASPPVRIQPRSYQQKQTTYTSSTMSRVVVVSASGASTTRDKKLNEIILTCRIILNGCQFRLHCPLSAMYVNQLTTPAFISQQTTVLKLSVQRDRILYDSAVDPARSFLGPFSSGLKLLLLLAQQHRVHSQWIPETDKST